MNLSIDCRGTRRIVRNLAYKSTVWYVRFQPIVWLQEPCTFVQSAPESIESQEEYSGDRSESYLSSFLFQSPLRFHNLNKLNVIEPLQFMWNSKFLNKIWWIYSLRSSSSAIPWTPNFKNFWTITQLFYEILTISYLENFELIQACVITPTQNDRIKFSRIPTGYKKLTKSLCFLQRYWWFVLYLQSRCAWKCLNTPK